MMTIRDSLTLLVTAQRVVCLQKEHDDEKSDFEGIPPYYFIIFFTGLPLLYIENFWVQFRKTPPFSPSGDRGVGHDGGGP